MQNAPKRLPKFTMSVCLRDRVCALFKSLVFERQDQALFLQVHYFNTYLHYFDDKSSVRVKNDTQNPLTVILI